MGISELEFDSLRIGIVLTHSHRRRSFRTPSEAEEEKRMTVHAREEGAERRIEE